MHYIIRSIVPVTGFRAVYSYEDGTYKETSICALAIADEIEVTAHGREKIDSTFGRAVVGLDCSESGICVVNEASNFLCILGPSDEFDVGGECPCDPNVKIHSRIASDASAEERMREGP